MGKEVNQGAWIHRGQNLKANAEELFWLEIKVIGHRKGGMFRMNSFLADWINQSRLSDLEQPHIYLNLITNPETRTSLIKCCVAEIGLAGYSKNYLQAELLKALSFNTNEDKKGCLKCKMRY